MFFSHLTEEEAAAVVGVVVDGEVVHPTGSVIAVVVETWGTGGDEITEIGEMVATKWCQTDEESEMTKTDPKEWWVGREWCALLSYHRSCVLYPPCFVQNPGPTQSWSSQTQSSYSQPWGQGYANQGWGNWTGYNQQQWKGYNQQQTQQQVS